MLESVLIGFLVFIAIILVRNNKLYREAGKAYERQEKSLQIQEKLLVELQECNKLLTEIANK
jgi:large-conductance mechanosensitive channel